MERFKDTMQLNFAHKPDLLHDSDVLCDFFAQLLFNNIYFINVN